MCRYDKHSLQAFLSEHQEARFQQCRSSGCQSGQQCFPEQDSFIICQTCKGRTCITCDTLWHPDQTCVEAEAAKKITEAHTREEISAQRYLAVYSKLCPKCEIRGYKVEGCDHIRCKYSSFALCTKSFSQLNLLAGPRCHYEYCWVCLANYSQILRLGNENHLPNCRHHTNNLNRPRRRH